MCFTSRCPYRDDRYLSSLVPIGPSSGLEIPGHYRRFLFKMFTFVDGSSMEPVREQVMIQSIHENTLQQSILYCSAITVFLVQVYIHCSTAVCLATPGHNCEPSCYRKSKRLIFCKTLGRNVLKSNHV